MKTANLSALTQSASRLARQALDLVLPPSCAGCGVEGEFICRECVSVLPRLERPYCALCARPGQDRLCEWCAASCPRFDGVRAPYLFEGAARQMVHGLKYDNFRAYAPELGRLLAEYAAANPVPMDVLVLVPVPLHKRRERDRGYNQSELLARELGNRIGIPVDSGALHRIRNTPPQVSIENYEERRGNIEGAFQCVPELQYESVLLIYDVVTTGSTMSACASVLKAAGARSVWGLALARQG